MPAKAAFNAATTSKPGAIPVAIMKPLFRVAPPRKGASGKTIRVFIATPIAKAGMKADLLNLFVKPIAAPARAMPNAMGIWSTPSGKPLITAVARCPNPHTAAPSNAPKYNATKKPAKESKAIELAGSGLMSEPTMARDVKMAMRAVRTLGLLLRK